MQKQIKDIQPGEVVEVEIPIRATWRVVSIERNPRRTPDSDWNIASHVTHLELVEADEVPATYDLERGCALTLEVVSDG